MRVENHYTAWCLFNKDTDELLSVNDTLPECFRLKIKEAKELMWPKFFRTRKLARNAAKYIRIKRVKAVKVKATLDFRYK